MEKFKNVGLAVFAVAVFVLGGMVFSKSTVVEHLNTIEKAGSVTGPDVYQQMNLHSDLVVGGGVYATTTTSGTYAANVIANNRLITETGATAVTRTMPTRASLDSMGFIPNAGDTMTRYVFASTSVVTFVGGAGVLLHGMGTTTLAVMASSTARIDFVRLNAANSNAIEALIWAD